MSSKTSIAGGGKSVPGFKLQRLTLLLGVNAVGDI